MTRIFERFRNGARRWLGKVENLSHVGYFGAIVMSGHDPVVMTFAGLCALLILLVWFLGAE